MSLTRPLSLLVSVLLVAVACTQAGATAVPATPAPTPTAAAVTPEPTAEATPEATPEATAEPTAEATPEVTPEATPEPTPEVTPEADACAPDTIASMLKNPGRLTMSTDIPAFPPWWGGDAAEQYENEPEAGSPWSVTDFSAEPYSMEGFEGATSYAVAAAMGFTPDMVDWIANPEFSLAFQPGDKPFDMHLAQISATEERATAVTFSDPYFDSNQSVLALTPNGITAAASIEDLKAFRLGAAANTTSFDFLENTIAPTTEPLVFPDNTAALAALQGDTVDGLIVDLSTAFYMRDALLENFDTEEPEGTIVGQFGPPAEPDHVAFVLQLDNPLAACANQAIAEIKESGELQTILDEWINTGEDVPFLE